MPVVKWLVIKLLRGLQPKPTMSRSKGTSNPSSFLITCSSYLSEHHGQLPLFGHLKNTITRLIFIIPPQILLFAKSHNHSTALTARPPLSFFPKLNVPTSQSSAICPYLPETFPGWQWCHSPKVIAKTKVQIGIERLENCSSFYINSVSSQWLWSISPETLVSKIHHFRSNLLPFPVTTKCRPSGHLPWFRGTRLHHEAQHISSQRLLSIRTWERSGWFNILISDLSM